MAKSRAVPWTAEKYKAALKGDRDGLPGLRSVAKGFAASEGFNLHDVDSWTRTQKNKVKREYDRLYHLYAQGRRVVRPRNEKNLKALQGAFHGDVPSKGFKVALVPWTEPAPLPGAKRRKPRISFLKSGITIDAGPFQRHFVPFDAEDLATDTDNEIRRAIAQTPGARLHYIQAGQFQTLIGGGPRQIADRVKALMMKYDGVSAIRSGSNAGDDPRNHDWRNWLKGIVSYTFPKNIDISTLSRAIDKGIKEGKARRLKQNQNIRAEQKSNKRKRPR